MTNDLEQLARRAVACPAWRWMPGMAAVGPWRVLTVAEDGYPLSMFATAHHHPRGWWGLAGQPGAACEVIPDLTDPATLGCLLALVREAWGGGVHQRPKSLVGGWFVLSGDWRTLAQGPTEAEALVAALEAAPAREVKP